ncbi:MAG: hypothetical protein H5T99_03545 [Moorella sp. (in: Bacteria)]|nr:hypothetical protein [Moorella sp. (in: firmicutes)]
MGYAEDYFALMDALEQRLKSDPRLAQVKAVFFGEREKVGQLQFPCLFIIPGQDSIADMSAMAQQHTTRFELVAVLKDPDAEQDLRRAIELAGDVYDVLMEDRSLGGPATTCDYPHSTPGTFGPRAWSCIG